MFILKLLNNILQPCMYKDIEEIGKNFKIEDNIQLYGVSFQYLFAIYWNYI